MMVEDDLGDGMHCSDHPLRANPGGICALCLQDKLGKLVSNSSSSFPLPLSSSPSFRSAETATASTRIPFLVAQKKKKVPAADALFKRSKSASAAPRRSHFLDADSPRKRSGFWSFLHLTSSKSTAKLQTSVDRKVSRSRSVGCGSRRFSGDFFERISTGFGDCTLGRAESQRQGKPKPKSKPPIKERAKCGGIFGGFITTSSSSSSSSSAEEVGPSRSRSWGWALASPMRAFSKPSSGKSRQASDNNPVPSLLAARP